MRAFRLAYDGGPYYGFQRQPDVSTVEGVLLDALAALDVVEASAEGAPTATPPAYAAAGRTDAGVSAVAQTVAFEAPEWCTARAINSALPGSIRAWAAAAVPADFHATRDATRREYAYHLHAPGADLDRAAEATAALSGEHDFHNLTSDDERTVRDVTASVARDGEFLVFRVAAGGFPRGFVRRFVAVVESVATGRASLDRIDRVLGSESLRGPAGVSRAPPEPLILTAVSYPGVEFERDVAAAESAGEVFEEIRASSLARARVADSVLAGIE